MHFQSVSYNSSSSLLSKILQFFVVNILKSNFSKFKRTRIAAFQIFNLLFFLPFWSRSVNSTATISYILDMILFVSSISNKVFQFRYGQYVVSLVFQFIQVWNTKRNLVMISNPQCIVSIASLVLLQPLWSLFDSTLEKFHNWLLDENAFKVYFTSVTEHLKL